MIRMGLDSSQQVSIYLLKLVLMNSRFIIKFLGQLREIIAELDPRLTDEDLDGIIEEIDEDGSGNGL